MVPLLRNETAGGPWLVGSSIEEQKCKGALVSWFLSLGTKLQGGPGEWVALLRNDSAGGPWTVGSCAKKRKCKGALVSWFTPLRDETAGGSWPVGHQDKEQNFSGTLASWGPGRLMLGAKNEHAVMSLRVGFAAK